MMTIKTYLAPDSHGGTGLFCGEDIKEGTIVWSFEDGAATTIYTLEEYQAAIDRHDNLARTLRKYAYPMIPSDKSQPPVIFHDTDDGSYMNHSDSPNIGLITSKGHLHYQNRDDYNIALKDIRKGEELTCNYFAFDPDLEVSRLFETCCSFLIGKP